MDNVKDFATIREIDGYQVLFYTESDDDGSKLHIKLRSRSGINCNLTFNYQDDEESMERAFQVSKDGLLDGSDFLLALISTARELDQDV